MNSENDNANAARPPPSATNVASDVISKEDSCARGKDTPDPINAHSRRKHGRHKRKMGNQQPTGETDTKKKSKRKNKNKNENRNSGTNASLSSESFKSDTGHQETVSCGSTETGKSNEGEWLPVTTAYTTAMVKRSESLREQSSAVGAACKPKTTGSRVVDSLIIQNVYTKEPDEACMVERTATVKRNVIEEDDNSTESRDMSSLGSFEILLPSMAAYDNSFENAHDDIFKDSKDTWSDDASFTSIGEVYHSLPKHTDSINPKDEIVTQNDKSDLRHAVSTFDKETKLPDKDELSSRDYGDYHQTGALWEVSKTRNSGSSDLKLKTDISHETIIPVEHTSDNDMQLKMVATNETDSPEKDISDRDLTQGDGTVFDITETENVPPDHNLLLKESASTDMKDLNNKNDRLEANDTNEYIDSRDAIKDNIFESFGMLHEYAASPKQDDLSPLQTSADQSMHGNLGPKTDGCICTLIETEILKQTERCESFETADVVYSKIKQKDTSICNDSEAGDNVATVNDKIKECGENHELMEHSCNIIDDRLLIKESDVPNDLKLSSPEQDNDAHDTKVDRRDESNANGLSVQQDDTMSNEKSACETPVAKSTHTGSNSDDTYQHATVHTAVVPNNVDEGNETVYDGTNNDKATSVALDEGNNVTENSGDDIPKHSTNIDVESTVSPQALAMHSDWVNEETIQEINENTTREEAGINTNETDARSQKQTPDASITDDAGDAVTDLKATKSSHIPKSLPLSHVPPPSPSTMAALEEEEEEGSGMEDAVISTPQDQLGETLMAKLSLLGELQSNYENIWQHLSSDSDNEGQSRDETQTKNIIEQTKASRNNNANGIEIFGSISPATTEVNRDQESDCTSPLPQENAELKSEPASETMNCVNDFLSCTTADDMATESDTIYSSAGTDTVAMVESSANEETHSEMSTPTPTPSLRLPNLADTLPVMLELKQIFEDNDEQTPVIEELSILEPRREMKSPTDIVAGSRRRSRTSPAITDKSITESELDISEQRDDISTDSMYADDEDDFVSEVLFSKTYTEPTQGGEVLVSCTLVNTPNQDLDSDEFWAESASSENAYRDIESSVHAASSTYCNARRQMQDIHHHLQDLREQMAHLHAEIESATLSIDIDYGSDDRFAATD